MPGYVTPQRVWWLWLLVMLLVSCAPTPKPIFPAGDTLTALQLLAQIKIEPVRISVYPQAAFPSTFRILIRTAQHPDNRQLCFELQPLRKSCHAVDGEHEPRSWTIFYEIRSPGNYTATADLLRVEGGREKHYLASSNFQVLGPGGLEDTF